MKKTWKKFAVIATVLCLLVTFCALFTACGEKDNGIYTINVVDSNGKGIAGVTVKMCTLNDKGEEENCQQFPSDANGVITADLRKVVDVDDDGNPVYEYTHANYHVTVIYVPNGYSAGEYGEGVSKLTTKDFKNNKYTITLTAE